MSAIRRLCQDTIAEFWEEVTHLQDGFPGGDEVVAAAYFEANDVHVKAHEIASAGGTALAYKEHAFSGALMCQNPEAHHIFERNSRTAKPLDQRKWQSSTCLIPTFCTMRRACGEYLDLLGKKLVFIDRVVVPWPSKSLTAKQKKDGDAWNAKFIKLLLNWGLLEPEVFVAVGAVANEFPEQPCFEGLGFAHVHHALHPSPNSFAPELFKLLSLSHAFCAAVDIIRNKGEASFDAQAYTAYFKKVNEQAGMVVSSDIYQRIVDQIVEADVDLHVRGAWREMVEKCPVFREQLSTWKEPFADPYNFSELQSLRVHRRWDPLDANQRREAMAPVNAASRAARLGVPINLLPPPTQPNRPLGGGTLHEQRCSVCFTAGHRSVTCPTLGKKRKPRSAAQDRAAEKRKQKRKAAAMQRKRGPASPPRKEALPQGPVLSPPPHHLGGEGLPQGPVLTPPRHLGGEGALVENLAACGYPREQARVALARCSGSPCVRLNAALDLLLER